MPNKNTKALEEELEIVSQAVRDYQQPLSPPMFELYASMVSMSIATVMFLQPGIIEQRGDVYYFMRYVSDQGGWAFAFFVSGLLSTFGMLTGKRLIRIIALVLMTILFGIMTVIYVMSFPNFGTVLLFWQATFTAASIPLVKRTCLRH